MASVATAQPHNGGGACPSREAMGGMNRKPPSASNSAATAPRSSRLVVQPKAPGQRVVLRQANALAIWPRTTALKAAPEAASSVCPVGNSVPGRQPAVRKGNYPFGECDEEHYPLELSSISGAYA